MEWYLIPCSDQHSLFIYDHFVHIDFLQHDNLSCDLSKETDFVVISSRKTYFQLGWFAVMEKGI